MKKKPHISSITTSKQKKLNIKVSHQASNKTINARMNNEKVYRNSKKMEEDYLMIDGNIYKANTNTQRLEMSCFVNRMKRQVIFQKSVKVENTIKQRFKYSMMENRGIDKNIDVQQIIKYLSLEQKLILMRQLQKQLETNPQFATCTNSFLQNNKQVETEDDCSQKYKILDSKLNHLESELQAKRQSQVEKINKLFYDGQLTAVQRKNKISGIDKIKDKKMKIIYCTRNLFFTLLHNKFQPDFFKGNNIEDAMKEFDSFSDFDNNANIQQQVTITKDVVSLINNSNDNINLTLNVSNKYQNQSFSNHDIHSQSSIDKQTDTNNYNSEKYHHQSHFLYQSEENIESNKVISVNEQLLIQPEKSFEGENQNKNEKYGHNNISNIANSNNNSRNSNNQNDENLQCSEQSLPTRLRIPLLLTKQKIEEMEEEKKNKTRQKLATEIDQKIAFQMSDLEIEDVPTHFTTLADINKYIVSLYEYVMKTDLQRIVDRLNFPYGKPICDKLFFLQQSGKIDETQYYPVLDETHFNGFNMEMALTIRRFSDEEKIHNRAVFDCFNTHLNAYRPYYDLEGDIYPWVVSEKGITFYQIHEDNIEEVFEKAKIKVLEYSSLLCGIIPIGMKVCECPELIKQKNKELSQKQQKFTINQQFEKWNIKLVNFDAIVRLLISQEIFLQQIMKFSQEMFSLQNTKESN